MATNYDDGSSRWDSGVDFWDEVTPPPTPATIGSQADIFNRLRALIPASWLPIKATPNFDATLQGPSWALSTIYTMITYVALQTRIKTATDGYLDLIAYDFFGSTLTRLTAEPDSAFRSRILANLFVRGPTRADMGKVLTLMTGTSPTIFEPTNTTDSGGWDGQFYWDAGSPAGGGWGDPLPYTSMITVYRPIASGQISSLGEFDSWRWFFGANGYWSDNPGSPLPDAAIIAAVEATRAVGTVVFLRIANSPVSP